MRTVRIIGPGRVGRSLGRSLEEAGWGLQPYVKRTDDPARAAAGVDLLVITTPDAAIAGVANAVRPQEETVVVHCSGALDLDVLAPHRRRASLHPLASLPDADIGAARLADGCAFAVDGDPLVDEVVTTLGGRSFRVAAEQRTLYHAAATIAANHLVALMGQVERVAAAVGLPLDAYLDLAAQSLDNVRSLGPVLALTGPVARGDHATVARHIDALAALDPGEVPAYEAMAELAGRLVDARSAA